MPCDCRVLRNITKEIYYSFSGRLCTSVNLKLSLVLLICNKIIWRDITRIRVHMSAINFVITKKCIIVTQIDYSNQYFVNVNTFLRIQDIVHSNF